MNVCDLAVLNLAIFDVAGPQFLLVYILLAGGVWAALWAALALSSGAPPSPPSLLLFGPYQIAICAAGSAMWGGSP